MLPFVWPKLNRVAENNATWGQFLFEVAFEYQSNQSSFYLGTIQVLCHQRGGWVGSENWQFLMIYSTVNHQRVRWVGLNKSKTWWRNTWMVPYLVCLYILSMLSFLAKMLSFLLKDHNIFARHENIVKICNGHNGP